LGVLWLQLTDGCGGECICIISCCAPELIYRLRLFVYYRLAAIRLVLLNLAKADGRIRSMDSIMALGAICIYMSNASFTRPAEGFGWEDLIEISCQQVLEDPDDDADDEDAPTVPILYDRGTYFICDIVLNRNPAFFRMPVQRTFDADSMARIYHKTSVDDIRASFTWSTAPLSKRLPNPDRTQNRKKRKTRDVDDIREPDRQRLRLDTEIRGVRIKPAVRLVGRDVDLHVIDGGDEREFNGAGDNEQGERTVNERAAKIYEQFFLDIIEEAPNRRSAELGSYLTIPVDMRGELARPELLQTAELPFELAQYCVCTPEQWEMHFDRLFPVSATAAARSPGRQNYGKCTYYSDYLALARVISVKSLAKTRRALRVEFDKLVWVPYTQWDRIWSTRKMDTSSWKALPSGTKGGPLIGINPRRARERVTLRAFDQPHEGDQLVADSEGEMED
jgi:hypothetical protein